MGRGGDRVLRTLSLAVGHRDGRDLELAPRMRGQADDLHRGRRGQVALQVLVPDAVEVVLLRDVGQVPGDRHEVTHRTAGRGQRLPEMLERETRLLAHGGRQIEVFLPVWMVVVNGRGRDAREEHETTATDHDAGSVRHEDAGGPVAMVDDAALTGDALLPPVLRRRSLRASPATGRSR